MMNRHLILFLACLTFLSCQKIDFDSVDYESRGESVTDGNVKINFQITSMEQIPFENTTARATSVSSLCTRFTVALFQGDTKVKAINQTTDDSDFGTITMSLQPGEYQLVAIAHNGLGNCTVTSPEKITFYNNKMTDTFYYYGTLEVSEDCTKSLSLKRAVSMFRFIITDNMPTSVAQMKFYYTGGSSTFNAVTGYGCVNSRQTEIFNISESDYDKPSTFEVYSFPHALTDSLNVKVTAFDVEGGTLIENTYSDIPIKLNTITQHTATFFSGVTGSTSMTSSFTIEGDGQWDATIDK